jgi:hypothetical protein
MTTITRIYSWGTGEWLSVLMECGHRRKVRRDEAKAEQLMVGKKVTCAECEPGKLLVLPGGRSEAK